MTGGDICIFRTREDDFAGNRADDRTRNDQQMQECKRCPCEAAWILGVDDSVMRRFGASQSEVRRFAGRIFPLVPWTWDDAGVARSVYSWNCLMRSNARC